MGELVPISNRMADSKEALIYKNEPEFNKNFKEVLRTHRAQAIDMESATLFAASYYYKLPMGALYIISDLPLEVGGIKTKESSEKVYNSYTSNHVEKGISVINAVQRMIERHFKGAYRGQKKQDKINHIFQKNF